jgi:hypothetical protein
MADLTQAPEDTAATDDTATDTSAGYVIEIKCKPDGTFAVGVEPMAEEAQEESGEDGGASGGSGEGGADENYQTCTSLGAALRLVKDIVAHAGNKEDMQAGADEMSAGYSKGT